MLGITAGRSAAYGEIRVSLHPCSWTYVGAVIPVLQTEHALPIITHVRGRDQLGTVLSTVIRTCRGHAKTGLESIPIVTVQFGAH